MVTIGGMKTGKKGTMRKRSYEAGDEPDEQDVPEELENMANHVDELLVSWMESRKKMQEMAKSRGFYPVFAIPPEVKQTFSQSNDKGKGKGSYGRKGGKGKGKPKGKEKERRKEQRGHQVLVRRRLNLTPDTGQGSRG